MAIELHSPHSELGAWRGTHLTDDGVTRHLVLVKGGLALAALLALLALPLLATPYPPLSLLALALGGVLAISLLASRPRGKALNSLWSWHALTRGSVRIDLFADGFVLSDRRGARAIPWEAVRAVRHPLFRQGNWSRDVDACHYTQQAGRLIVELPGRERLILDDLLEQHQELAEEFQRQVYPRLVRLALEDYTDGLSVPFGTLGVNRHGIHTEERDLAWSEVAALELKGTRLRVVRAGWPSTFVATDAGHFPNFPVLMALLERDQPDLARDLLDGLPLDSAAQLWQRAARLREQPRPDLLGPPDLVGPLDDVPDHSGRPFRSDADLFVPPPPEIGLLISAGTTLTRGRKPYRMETRLLACLGTAGLALLPGFGLTSVFGWRHPVWLALGFGLVPTVAVLLVWMATRFAHQVTYVGTRGLARFCCQGSRDNIVDKDLLLFRDAAEVHTTLTHRYTKNGYQGSDYGYIWSSPGGTRLFRIAGTYHSEKEPPPPLDSFHFGESADVAWSLHLLDQLQERLEGEGVEFYLEDRDSIRVSPGLLRFRLGGHQSECLIEDLGESSLKGGVLKLRRHDAQVGWFSSTGVYEVDLAQLGNARLFLFLLRTVVAFGSTHAADHWNPSAARRGLDRIATGPWPQDPRASACIRKVLSPEAAARALDQLDGVRARS